MKLSEICIYPIKSLGGIRLEKANVMAKGLEFDRRWMLIDDDGVAMTQRVYPEMALFKVRMEHNRIHIDYTSKDAVISSAVLSIANAARGRNLKAKVWDDTVEVTESEPELSEWFSHHLRRSCRLVSFPERNARPVDPEFSVHDEQVSLADAFPFMVIGQSSLDDLNARMDKALPMNRFRPNFVFTGGKPFAEDDWRHLSIGPVRFIAVKKCARCILTTVDQDTASRGAEPMKTLSGYRKRDNKIYFGQNLIAFNEGVVRVGDDVIPG